MEKTKIDDTLASYFINRKHVSVVSSSVVVNGNKVMLYIYNTRVVTATFSESGVIQDCCIDFSESTTTLTLLRVNAVLALMYKEDYLKHLWKVYNYGGKIYLFSVGKSLMQDKIQICPNKIDIILLDVERSMSSSAENIHTLSAEAMIMALL